MMNERAALFHWKARKEALELHSRAAVPVAIGTHYSCWEQSKCEKRGSEPSYTWLSVSNLLTLAIAKAPTDVYSMKLLPFRK